jgi:hypothetical protein
MMGRMDEQPTDEEGAECSTTPFDDFSREQGRGGKRE